MAEFALGLTKTVVEGTLSFVKSAVEEEEKLREVVQNDLVFITGEFEVMQSFLQAAKREHAASDKVALTLLRQLRTLAFDFEDCVEFVVHLDLDKSSILGGLRRLWQTVNCRAPPLPLDVAVAEIKQLKARVEHVSQRNTRYNNILHGSDDDDNNKQQQQPLPAQEPPYATTTTSTCPSSAALHALRDAWEATGKLSNNICNLQQLLLIAGEGEGHHDLRVISVWGSGITGVGDAACPGTASKAYCDPKIRDKFKICAWVKLTHPFNHVEFVMSLLAQFYASSSDQAEVVTQDNLNLMKAKLMQQMREQRYLLVLEDVLTVAEWHVIKVYLPDSKNGSRVLLSTPQLHIAFLCTGEPYQVSDLRNFSGDIKFLYAFSKKEKTSSDIGAFYRQLLRGHGVISVWGDDDDEKSNLVDILYRGIINGWLEEIGGVTEKSDQVDMLYEGIRARRREFKRQHISSWVDVPDPFDLKVFAQRLFLNFHSDDIRTKEITEVGMKGKEGLIQWCREFLSEGKGHDPYVVVINGLRSEGDWALIQSTFFSPETPTAQAGCILVITKEESLATHCVKDQTHLAFNAKDLKADPSISALIEKGCWQYAIRGKKGRLFYDRKKDAREWANKFGNVVSNILDPDEGKDEEGFHVVLAKGGKKDYFMVKANEESTSVEEEGWNSQKGVLRHSYYGALLHQQIERCCSWVESPCHVGTGFQPPGFSPLNLTDFSWRLLLDFYSDDPQAKEEVAVGLMEGTIDPFEKCREFLHNKKCLVVINGVLKSKKDWNRISTFFREQHTQTIIIVRSTLRDYIYDDTANKVLRLMSTRDQDVIDMEYRRIFSSQKKYQEAIQWLETSQFVRRGLGEGSGGVEDDIRTNVLLVNLVSVWGMMPGVGKSTLVRMVYYKEILYSSGVESSYGLGPTEAFAWVDVPSPFNLTDFAWRLLLDFYSDCPHAKETAAVSMVEEGRRVPILECRKILRTGKCLVVMDGLRSKQDWNMIKDTFLAKDIQATIVVITDEEEVAMHCVENEELQAVNITRLNGNAALSLFEKIASKDKQLTPEEKVLSKSIVHKCGGLPKVIANIGEVFPIVGRKWSNPRDGLEYLRDNFMGALETDLEFQGIRPLLSWMQSYFDACSDSMKPCIFYLSIFSAEKNIRLRRLLWRWIAEGYCRDTSDGTTYEENGKNFISELVKLSIIQKSASSNVLCLINGFFHEYIISRTMEDNLVFALEGRCSLNLQRAGQHLAIRSSWDRNEIVYENIDFSRLRSLTVFGKWESFFLCSKEVNMRLLRVLDLEDATNVENGDLEKIGKLLPRLKYLSLRGLREITYLPISMGGLRQLQTLDIRGTSVVMLPLFITKLQKLRYIRAGTTEVCDWEGDIVAADGEEDMISSSARAVTNLPPAAEEGDDSSADGEEDKASAAAEEECDDSSADGEEDMISSSARAVTNLPPAAEEGDDSSADGEEDKTSAAAQAIKNLPAAATTPTEGPVLPAEPGSLVPCNNKARTLVSSLLFKLCRHGGGGLGNNGPAAASVTVPADIGNLTFLHTLGVVKVSAQCGKAIFQELKKLTQLRKLGVSGINKENIKEFCEAISDHAHLKSLSVELDKDDDLGDNDNIPKPPKTIQSLKLYGHVHKLVLIWTKHLDNLQKLHLTIETPEESRDLVELSMKHGMGHLRMGSIQDSELHIVDGWILPEIVEIQCSSKLHIKFCEISCLQESSQTTVLKVHFSGGSQSSLTISGLSQLTFLEEVWLKGYTDANKQDMQRQINEMELDPPQKKPVLKLVQTRSS